MSDFGELRSLLHGASPTRTTFDAVVQAFKEAGDPSEAERVWLPYAVEQMRGWPLESRHVTVARFDEDELGALGLAASATLECRDAPEDAVESLIWSPRVAGLAAMKFTGASPSVFEWLATSDHSAGLKHLSVQCEADGDLSLSAFSVQAPFTLETFELEARGLGDVWARSLFASPAFSTLRELELSECGLHVRGLEFLLTRPWFSKLTRFHLSSRTATVSPEFIAALPPRPPFTSIDVSFNRALSDAAVAAMIDAGWMDGSLREVDFDFDDGLDVFHALARRPGFDAIERLRLSGDAVGRGLCEALSTSELPSLHELDLYGPELSPLAILLLLRSPGLPSLTSLCASGSTDTGSEDVDGAAPDDRSSCTVPIELSLHHLSIGPRAMEALVRTKRVERTTCVSVAFNPLGVEGARALGRAELFELEELDVENCGLGDEGVQALLDDAGRRFPRLTKLDLYNNGITNASRDALPGSGLRGLKELLLWDVGLGAPFVEALVSSPVVDTLTFLDIDSCTGPDEVLSALGRSPRLGSLRGLHVCGDGFVEEGLRALVGSTALEGLVELQMSLGGYDDDAFRALMHSPCVRTLKLINFRTWTLEMWKACATSPHLPAATMDYSDAPLMRQAIRELVRDGATLNAWAESVVERLEFEGEP